MVKGWQTTLDVARSVAVAVPESPGEQLMTRTGRRDESSLDVVRVSPGEREEAADDP
jgi:hypothetical protein